MLNIKMQSPVSEKHGQAPKITVIGVGGAGGNGVDNMIASGLEGCVPLVCNTDAQALAKSRAENTIQLGEYVTGGLGAGAKPEIGRAAAEESLEDVLQFVEGSNMVFITAGMGGGTGTGAAPVIAKACRDLGILTVGVVTKPFHFEGSHRMKLAEAGLEEMQKVVDTLIVIPNQNLFRVANEKTTFAEAFKMSDGVLQSGVRGVTDLMVRPGLVNLDFADIKTAMQEMGKAMMGTGEAEGEKRAVEAAEAAINNPLLDDVSMKGARGLIINITGGYDMTLFEADEAANRIRDEVDPEANIIFGATFDENMDGKMRVSIVATGIESEGMKNAEKPQKPLTINRVQPKTVDTTPPKKEDVAVNAVNVAPPAQATTITAPPAPQSDTVQAAAPQPFEPEADLFEQQQYGQSETGTPRAIRYENTFIPPKPVEVQATQPQSFHGQSSSYANQQSEEGETSASSGGLKLNPPKMPTPGQRRPSLFERITESVTQKIEGLSGTGRDEVGFGYEDRRDDRRHAGPVFEDQAPQEASQGQLNIDKPSAPKSDDDLDIPAFLRRQAN